MVVRFILVLLTCFSMYFQNLFSTDKEISFLADEQLSQKEPPVWPEAFNSTLAKIAPGRESIVWVKHYYDWPKKGQRFDFFNSYVEYPNASWNLNCSVLFINKTIWFIFPEEKACKLRSSVIPPVNPQWLKLLNATFAGNKIFRGIEAELWQMDDPDDKSQILEYYSRADNNRIPLRSPNQINDPGATDFFDVEIGSQNKKYFEVPWYCESTRVEKGCPWY
jgi:hypothetical protein